MTEDREQAFRDRCQFLALDEGHAEGALARNIADKLRVELDEARADAVSWERQCDDARKLADLMGQERDEARADRDSWQRMHAALNEEFKKLHGWWGEARATLARLSSVAVAVFGEVRHATEDMRTSRQLALVSYADRIDAALRLAEGVASGSKAADKMGEHS